VNADEQRRLAVVETRLDNFEEMLGRIDKRTETLADAYTMGKGAWKAAMKIGGMALLIAAAGAWLIDHLPNLPQWLKG
jgi:hypothetical protein